MKYFQFKNGDALIVKEQKLNFKHENFRNHCCIKILALHPFCIVLEKIVIDHYYIS